MSRAAEAFEATLAQLGLSDRADADPETFGRRAALLAASDLLWERELGPLASTAQVCGIIGVSRQAIHERVQRGTLLALPASGGGYTFPLFQFGDNGRPLRRLSELIEIFLSDPPAVETTYTIASWLVTPQPELEGRTPIALLRDGDDEPVRVAARRYADRLRR